MRERRKQRSPDPRNSHRVGSCGIYVVYQAGTEQPTILSHRRGKDMAGGYKIATPGGIVDSWMCGETGDDFETGALATAIKELDEEAGLQIDPQLTPLHALDAYPYEAYWANSSNCIDIHEMEINYASHLLFTV